MARTVAGERLHRAAARARLRRARLRRDLFDARGLFLRRASIRSTDAFYRSQPQAAPYDFAVAASHSQAPSIYAATTRQRVSDAARLRIMRAFRVYGNNRLMRLAAARAAVRGPSSSPSWRRGLGAAVYLARRGIVRRSLPQAPPPNHLPRVCFVSGRNSRCPPGPMM